jgi:Flp pilus assembly pilin Flp
MALSKFNTFVSDESGAVTVDWVVLTAAIVGLGLAVMSVVSGGVEDLSGNISEYADEHRSAQRSVRQRQPAGGRLIQ